MWAKSVWLELKQGGKIWTWNVSVYGLTKDCSNGGAGTSRSDYGSVIQLTDISSISEFSIIQLTPHTFP